MSKHTPGPWKWHMEVQERGPMGKGSLRYANLGRVLRPNWCTGPEGELWQAWVNVSEADAKLIAAAPELLEALQELYADYKALSNSGDAGPIALEDRIAGIKALAAIAKATS